MPRIKTIHQIFFNFDDRSLQDYPTFAASHAAFRRMRGWRYRLWNEKSVERLCKSRFPQLWVTYRRLRYPIQRVDLAKYMIAHAHGGLIADLDVLPRCHVSKIVAGNRPYVFDRCSRQGIIANDFFYAGPGGFLGIFEYFKRNLARVNSIPAYAQRKMRYVFQTSGPDFFTRYLKRAGLVRYVRAMSNRTFLDRKERHRKVKAARPYIDVIHHLSWVQQLYR